jgi:hypothetical protein
MSIYINPALPVDPINRYQTHIELINKYHNRIRLTWERQNIHNASYVRQYMFLCIYHFWTYVILNQYFNMFTVYGSRCNPRDALLKFKGQFKHSVFKVAGVSVASRAIHSTFWQQLVLVSVAWKKLAPKSYNCKMCSRLQAVTSWMRLRVSACVVFLVLSMVAERIEGVLFPTVPKNSLWYAERIRRHVPNRGVIHAPYCSLRLPFLLWLVNIVIHCACNFVYAGLFTGGVTPTIHNWLWQLWWRLGDAKVNLFVG